ncbi:hypothetical protein [Zobellia laminariae]|uniref:hypothetical protein n=1 Tax=Zobellia laminariae TaxID=248906 RepID=UPI003EF8505E
MSRKETLTRKRQLTINLIANSLKISLRFLKLLFNRKTMACISFQPDLEYCIEGTLNQLRWEVHNALFITISGSSQLFFDSGQLLSQVKKGQTELLLTAYGVGKKTKLFTQIKVVELSKKDFSGVETQCKNVALRHQKIKVNRKINHSSISFQNSRQPKPYNQIQIDINKSPFLKNSFTRISLTNSIQEIEKLKLLLETDLS